jgi:hypothetical protein
MRSPPWRTTKWWVTRQKQTPSRLQPATLFREGVSPSALNHARRNQRYYPSFVATCAIFWLTWGFFRSAACRKNHAFARAKNASTSVDAVKVAHHEESALADDEMVGYAPKINSEWADHPCRRLRNGGARRLLAPKRVHVSGRGESSPP